VPLEEGTSSDRFRTSENPDAETGPLIRFTFANGSYFSAMGVDVLEGRAFTDDDHTTTHGNIMISRSAADQLWPGQSAVGRRLQRIGDEMWHNVVGVVEDVRQTDMRVPPDPHIYLPLAGPTADAWMLPSPGYVVRTSRAETIAPEVRSLIREVAPEAPMYRVYTMDSLVARSMVGLTFTMLAIGITSLLALILGTVGVYGVLSYVVAGRTREIGVRMALGAEAREVRRMVVRQGLYVVGIGIVIGLVVARLSTRALGGLLYDVPPADVATFAGVTFAMVLVGGLASWVPALRASRVDPIESLRA
jgi:hypothetical protein